MFIYFYFFTFFVLSYKDGCKLNPLIHIYTNTTLFNFSFTHCVNLNLIKIFFFITYHFDG